MLRIRYDVYFCRKSALCTQMRYGTETEAGAYYYEDNKWRSAQERRQKEEERYYLAKKLRIPGPFTATLVCFSCLMFGPLSLLCCLCPCDDAETGLITPPRPIFLMIS